MNDSTIDYAITTAVSGELKPILDVAANKQTQAVGNVKYTIGEIAGKRVAMIASGIGTTCAAAVTTHMIQYFKPKALFFSGCAGGIDPSLSIGDVVIGSAAFEAEIQGMPTALQNTPFEAELVHSFKHEIQPTQFDADKYLFETAQQIADSLQSNPKNIKAKVSSGLLVTSNAFPAPNHLFEDIKHRGAVAIDMESSAIYQVSWLFNIPSLVIRGISNVLDSAGNDDDLENAADKIAANNACEFLYQLLEVL